VVIGAGAAGLLAAARAAERGRRTLLIEKNRKPGVKILISGGTRCNLTHDADAAGIVSAFGPQGRFLHSALAALSPRALVALVEQCGVATKTEPGGKIFPRSDRAIDVQRALLAHAVRCGVRCELGAPVRGIARRENRFELASERGPIVAERVVVTTGGRSYPGCGTTGDGYAWLAALGHTIVPPRPALVPLRTPRTALHALAGLTLPDVRVSVSGRVRRSPRAVCRGSLLFTHGGLSGPAVLNVSREAVPDDPAAGPDAYAPLELDFVPDEREADLAAWLDREIARDGRRTFATIFREKLPRRLADCLAGGTEEAAAPPPGMLWFRPSAEAPRAVRAQAVRCLKQFRVPISGDLGFAKAEVTAGGVALDEIHSGTMESRLCPGLFVAGEILDLDGPIGGYNFQAAFSTGWLAGDRI